MSKKNLISGLIVFTFMSMPLHAQDGPPPGNGNPRGQNNGENRPGGCGQPPATPQQTEQRLQEVINALALRPIDTATVNTLPVEHAKVQLGKKLFFTKNLGGEQDAACVSCHHPSLGGGDNLSLSVGINAIDMLSNTAHDLLGIGRFNGIDTNDSTNLPVVPRNAPSIFNIALFQRGLFWDSRVERVRNNRVVTPDSPLTQQGRRIPDPNLLPDVTLAAAQARFPVTSVEEMRGQFAPDENNQTLRNSLSARLSNQLDNIASQWPSEFALAYGDDTITPDRIFDAIGEYERAMIFVDSPWNEYLSGNSDALTEQQKIGATLFFTPPNQGGAGCVSCHSGANLSDERHHLTAFPQIGVGKGNTSTTQTSQDFGRENVTGDIADRFHFRTPSLLNIEVTAPYGHAGAYQTLEEVIEHYNNPDRAIDRLFAAQGNVPFVNGVAPYCRLPQINALLDKNSQNCEDIFADAYQNSKDITQYLQLAINNQVPARAPLRIRPNLNREQVLAIAAFLRALTDPCVKNRECLSPWIVEQQGQASFPDDKPVIAVDQHGDLL
ncbi:cytochrome-c peroxidase [Thalassotalea fusca]